MRRRIIRDVNRRLALSPAEHILTEIREVWPRSYDLALPSDLRETDITWELRKEPSAQALALVTDVVRVTTNARASIGGRASVAIEGVCRVTSGGPRDGAKSTCVVVHVIADGEPARVVFVPVE